MTPSALSLWPWKGQERYWPSVAGFHLEARGYGKYGDASAVEYRYEGRGKQFANLVVTFSAHRHEATDGKAPIAWKAESYGPKIDGTVATLEEIPRKLAALARWALQRKHAANAYFAKALPSSTHWNVNHDVEFFGATYKNPHSDAYMSVTFDDPASLLLGQRDTAHIRFARGSDYQGAYGTSQHIVTYGTLDEMRGVLKIAETHWKAWNR